jgi:hypothetical protein
VAPQLVPALPPVGRGLGVRDLPVGRGLGAGVWNRLSDVKVLLEVLVALVALIGAILALLGFRK